jgi:hypothetical protein
MMLTVIVPSLNLALPMPAAANAAAKDGEVDRGNVLAAGTVPQIAAPCTLRRTLQSHI